MFNSGFGALADHSINLYPETFRLEIDAWNERTMRRSTMASIPRSAPI
jgi:putative glutathione S-transferase